MTSNDLRDDPENQEVGQGLMKGAHLCPTQAIFKKKPNPKNLMFKKV